MKFATADVLGTSTGRLLGDIDGIYKVTSFLVGPDAFTHDLAFYGRRASAALKAALPDLPVRKDAEHVNGENYKDFLASWEAKLGTEIDIPDSLRGCLADKKDAMDTLTKMVGPKQIIVVDPSARE